MDIAEHLEMHEKVLRALASKYGGYDQDLVDDCYQAGALVLIEAHAGSFRHESELLTYVYDKVNEVMLKQVRSVKGVYRYGITDELDELQGIAEEQGRDRLHLESLYESPIPGLKSPLEQSLSFDDVEMARKVWMALSDEDKHVLEASYGRSTRRAADSLNLPLVTYFDRLQKAIERARELAELWRLWKD